MEIKSLKIFIEVMQCLSFTLVAKKLNVAPSSISRTIASLEQELNIKLFQRSTRKLVPTQAGVEYFEKVTPLVYELEVAKDSVRVFGQNPSGTLRVTTSTMYGQLFIAPLLPMFMKKFPDIKIELLLTDSYLDLIEQRIDVCIRTGSLNDSSYIVQKLKTMHYVVCASPDYLKKHSTIIAPKEVVNHNCLVFPREGHTNSWRFKQNNQIQSIAISGQCLITNSYAIKTCVLAHMGLAMLPDWLIRRELLSGELVDVFPHIEVTATDFNSGVYLMYPSRNYLPSKTQVFIDYLKNTLK